MKRNLVNDIEADRLGPQAIKIAIERAKELARRRKAEIDPNLVKLHGGISGLSVEKPIEIVSGLQLAPTYAHVMAPFIMAFKQPELGQAHPGPWKSASGGSARDIHTEATLDADARVGGFDRLNSIWFLVTLLRLRVSTAIRVPVVSDTTFSEVPDSKEPLLWPIEFRRPVHIALHQNSETQQDGLEWIVSNIENGSVLMQGEGFALALQTLDQAWFAESRGSIMVLLWSAIESLFRPGDRDITKVLARSIATYLNDEPRARDRHFQEIKDLYKVRGEMVHAARAPTEASIEATANIARRVFIRAIELREFPVAERLQIAWSERTAYQA